MKLQLATESIPGKVQLAAPEKDYLTRYDVESLYGIGMYSMELPVTSTRFLQQGRQPGECADAPYYRQSSSPQAA